MIYLVGCVLGFIGFNFAMLIMNGELEPGDIIKSIPLSIFSWLLVLCSILLVGFALFIHFCNFVDSVIDDIKMGR